ncbi:MAG: NAD(P)/FAD-dependent oxidoreductase [Luteimonas sp.]
MTSVTTDVLILGAGMAGLSLADALAPQRTLVVLEVEDHPGRHATGRSAAMYFETYGNATIRALTRASRDFLSNPPAGFSGSPLLTPRGGLFVSDTARLARLEAMRAESAGTLRPIEVSEALEDVPILDPEWVAGALYDDSGFDIDVAALLQRYAARARRAGVRLVMGARSVEIQRKDGLWHVHSAAGDFAAPVLVNATGAWADDVARSAGVRTVGLQPMRRTAMTLEAPPGLDIRAWPLVIDVDEEFYFKPDAGQLLLSPANEDLQAPGDAAADELDVAIAVDRFERATTLEVRRIPHRWAGLRSFVADRTPVVGFDPGTEGFFWLAAQGGYGIQTAPALAQTAAALVLNQPIPPAVRQEGVTAHALAPDRLGLTA